LRLSILQEAMAGKLFILHGLCKKARATIKGTAWFG
jgi:hypothetical protein